MLIYGVTRRPVHRKNRRFPRRTLIFLSLCVGLVAMAGIGITIGVVLSNSASDPVVTNPPSVNSNAQVFDIEFSSPNAANRASFRTPSIPMQDMSEENRIFSEEAFNEQFIPASDRAFKLDEDIVSCIRSEVIRAQYQYGRENKSYVFHYEVRGYYKNKCFDCMDERGQKLFSSIQAMNIRLRSPGIGVVILSVKLSHMILKAAEEVDNAVIVEQQQVADSFWKDDSGTRYTGVLKLETSAEYQSIETFLIENWVNFYMVQRFYYEGRNIPYYIECEKPQGGGPGSISINVIIYFAGPKEHGAGEAKINSISTNLKNAYHHIMLDSTFESVPLKFISITMEEGGFFIRPVKLRVEHQREIIKGTGEALLPDMDIIITANADIPLPPSSTASSTPVTEDPGTSTLISTNPTVTPGSNHPSSDVTPSEGGVSSDGLSNPQSEGTSEEVSEPQISDHPSSDVTPSEGGESSDGLATPQSEGPSEEVSEPQISDHPSSDVTPSEGGVSSDGLSTTQSEGPGEEVSEPQISDHPSSDVTPSEGGVSSDGLATPQSEGPGGEVSETQISDHPSSDVTPSEGVVSSDGLSTPQSEGPGGEVTEPQISDHPSSDVTPSEGGVSSDGLATPQSEGPSEEVSETHISDHPSSDVTPSEADVTSDELSTSQSGGTSEVVSELETSDHSSSDLVSSEALTRFDGSLME